jgi:hypothetical protein
MNLSGAKATSVWLDDFGFEPAPRRIATSIRDTALLIDKTPYHCANPIMYTFTELEEMIRWCRVTFGPGPKVWYYQSDPYVFCFGEEKHLTMFILRWS